jgi:hypothetical protein
MLVYGTVLEHSGGGGARGQQWKGYGTPSAKQDLSQSPSAGQLRAGLHGPLQVSWRSPYRVQIWRLFYFNLLFTQLRLSTATGNWQRGFWRVLISPALLTPPNKQTNKQEKKTPLQLANQALNLLNG